MDLKMVLHALKCSGQPVHITLHSGVAYELPVKEVMEDFIFVGHPPHLRLVPFTAIDSIIIDAEALQHHL